MQKGFGGLFIIIGMTALMLLGVGGFYVSKTIIFQPQNPAVTSRATSSPVLSASPAPNGAGETVNWKTYTNEKYRYLIRYPAIWKLQADDQNGILLSSPDLGYSEGSGYPNRGAMINIDVQVTDLKTLEEVYKQVSRNKFLKVTERKDIIVDGKSALRLAVNSIDAPSGPNIYILQNGKQYSFQFWQVGNNYEKTFDQILSTFKFLDQGKIDSISLLEEIKSLSDPNIQWEEVREVEQENLSSECEPCKGYKVNGILRKGFDSKGISFIKEEELIKMGWRKDPRIAGFSPGGMLWGYEKGFGNRKRLVGFSYQSFSFLKVSDDPVDANRPTEFSIFLTDEFSSD